MKLKGIGFSPYKTCAPFSRIRTAEDGFRRQLRQYLFALGGILQGMTKTLVAAACILLLSGCFSPSNTDSLREHTADATAAAKRDAGAIVRGVAEGLARKGPLDINEATIQQLTALPGVSNDVAKAIVEGRPYASSTELVRRRVMSKSEFNRIKAQIMVK